MTTWIFLAASFMMPPDWEGPRGPSAAEWVNKIQTVHRAHYPGVKGANTNTDSNTDAFQNRSVGAGHRRCTPQCIRVLPFVYALLENADQSVMRRWRSGCLGRRAPVEGRDTPGGDSSVCSMLGVAYALVRLIHFVGAVYST